MEAADGAPDYAQRLGIRKDQVVQELGWDTDTDDDIRFAIEDACGSELLTRTPTRSSTLCCCGGATSTVTWSTP